MDRTQFTHIEVVLLAWQQLPVELTRLNVHWTFLESRYYRIAQADIQEKLNISLLEFFEQLKREHDITDFCSRVVMVKSETYRRIPDTEQLKVLDLPDWVWAEVEPGSA